MRHSIEVIEHRPMRGMQIRAIAIIGLLSALDGYDVLAMTFAAPGITAAWGIGKAQLGLALASGLIGMTAGSLLFAPLGDRLGRRPIVTACLLFMALGMAMAALSRSVLELAVWRIVAGFGIGALVPIIASLAAEYANARRRRLAMAIMAIGYPLGGTIGGFGAAVLLRSFAWPVVFAFGAALTALLIVPTFLALIETPAFLIARRPRDALARLNLYLTHCGQPPLDALPPAPAAPPIVAYREIFSAAYRYDTLLITAIDVLYIVTVYYMLSWMPQLVADRGHSASFAAIVAATACLAGTVSCVAIGTVGARIPIVRLACATTAGMGVASLLFALGGAAPVILLLLGGLVGVFLYSGTMTLYSVIVATFDPRVRATGVGFVMGIGRAAGAAAPALAGLLFGLGTGRATVTALMALSSLLAALSIFANRRRIAA